MRRKLADELIDQQWDVVAAAIERRNLDRENIEAILEILAETLVADRLLEVAIGGRPEETIRQRLSRIYADASGRARPIAAAVNDMSRNSISSECTAGRIVISEPYS